jgi:hypothetical protein
VVLQYYRPAEGWAAGMVRRAGRLARAAGSSVGIVAVLARPLRSADGDVALQIVWPALQCVPDAAPLHSAGRIHQGRQRPLCGRLATGRSAAHSMYAVEAGGATAAFGAWSVDVTMARMQPGRAR